MKRIVTTTYLLLLLLPAVACSVPPAQLQTASAKTTVAKSVSADVTPETLAVQMMQSEPPLVLDVRSAREYAAGHIPGAVNVEHRAVRSHLDQLQAFQNRHVVLYCERGVRAERAEAVLLDAGFTNLSHLSGHMPAWRAAGFPIEVGTNE